MADTKISALPASTTPLAGTEVLPIVQGGVTRQVSIANLTAGRAVSASQLTLSTGNLIVADGQGIDFSATSGTGTSELFNDYEEGTWTPATLAAGGTYTAQSGTYIKVGRLVTLFANVAWSAHTGAGSDLEIGGFPFANSSGNTFQPGAIAGNLTLGAGESISSYILPNTSYIKVLRHTDLTGTDASYLIPASANMTIWCSYFSA
jgi:hypothetical protein